MNKAKRNAEFLILLSNLVDANLSKTDIKILYQILFEALGNDVDVQDDYFEINQSHIANLLDLKQPNINRSIKKMIDANILWKNSNGKYKLM